MPAAYVLTNATVVTAERTIAAGSVAIEGDTIVEVAPRALPGGPGVIDVGGRYVLPGLLDLHNDALEMEMAPRPGARFPPAFALLHLDRKLAAAGVTTQFHAVYFGDRPDSGRSLDFADEVCAVVNGMSATADLTVDHHALHRLDLRTAGALDRLLPAASGAALPLVSLNDHVPGRGQYRDVTDYRSYVRRFQRPDTGEDELDRLVAARVAEARRSDALVDATLARLARLPATGGLILASHDDDSPERVERMHALGCRIAEFPITAAAALRARECGMAVAMGAPNALRGGSITGNASALALMADGLVDILIADYAATTLLAAVFRAVELGLADLPAATRLVSANPAAAVGLARRGRLEPGWRADVIVVSVRAGVPLVDATIIAGVPVFVSAPLAMLRAE